MRVQFLIDGFNLYHSVKAAERQLQSNPLRWLDLPGLCTTLLRSTIGPGATLTGIHYFSALAKHLEGRKPDVVKRHRTYITALKGHGVKIHLSNFKRKRRQELVSEARFQIRPLRRWWRIPLPSARVSITTHEEKETDVAIATTLIDLLHRQKCDAAVLMTGDTDLAPAVRVARKLFPHAPISIAFPFLRHNRHLQRQVATSVKISARLYQQHQFPSRLVLPNGKTLTKPTTW